MTNMVRCNKCGSEWPTGEGPRCPSSMMDLFPCRGALVSVALIAELENGHTIRNAFQGTCDKCREIKPHVFLFGNSAGEYSDTALCRDCISSLVDLITIDRATIVELIQVLWRVERHFEVDPDKAESLRVKLQEAAALESYDDGEA